MNGIAYAFDPETGEYRGEVEAQESPLELGQGKYIIPANALDTEPPPHVEGKRRICVDGGWQYQDIPPEPPLPPKTVADLKAEKRRDINIECDKLIGAAVFSYPGTEILTFSKQETEARAYIADPLSATPMIDALAENREIDKAELVTRILAKADFFAWYTGKVIGYRQKLEDQINAATTPAGLAMIDPLAGWPT